MELSFLLSTEERADADDEGTDACGLRSGHLATVAAMSGVLEIDRVTSLVAQCEELFCITKCAGTSGRSEGSVGEVKLIATVVEHVPNCQLEPSCLVIGLDAACTSGNDVSGFLQSSGLGSGIKGRRVKSVPGAKTVDEVNAVGLQVSGRAVFEIQASGEDEPVSNAVHLNVISEVLAHKLEGGCLCRNACSNKSGS